MVVAPLVVRGPPHHILPVVAAELSVAATEATPEVLLLFLARVIFPCLALPVMAAAMALGMAVVVAVVLEMLAVIIPQRFCQESAGIMEVLV